MSVVFADCRDFTALTHEHGPEIITALVDEFFRQCSKIVVNLDGILDNFRGDAVLAFFNVPIKREDHITRAIATAHEMQLAVPGVNAKFGKEGLLKVGIGVTTGVAYASTVGSDDCKDYTIMGDVVNIGSRLQGLAAPGEILVSDAVYETVSSTFPNAREQVLELKGIKEPVKTYILT